MPSGVTRIFQLDGHCGPTTVQMMLRRYKVYLSQPEIARETKAGDTIHEHGCRIDQLGLAVSALATDYVLLAKYDATISEIRHIIEDFGMPVGVEWRGQFYREDGTRYEDGHYSVVTHVEIRRGVLKIVDPDETSVLPNGELSIEEFESRWWDENWLGSPEDPASPIARTFHLIFVVVPRSQQDTIQALGFTQPTMDLMRAHNRKLFNPLS